MAKKYIHLYYDYLDAIEYLGDAERGRLFTALLEYGNIKQYGRGDSGNTDASTKRYEKTEDISDILKKLTGSERILFPMMRAQIDRDNEGYEKTSIINSEKGKKGGRGNKKSYSFIKKPEKPRVYIKAKKAAAFLKSQKSQDKDKDKKKDKYDDNIYKAISIMPVETVNNLEISSKKTEEQYNALEVIAVVQYRSKNKKWNLIFTRQDAEKIRKIYSDVDLKIESARMQKWFDKPEQTNINLTGESLYNFLNRWFANAHAWGGSKAIEADEDFDFDDFLDKILKRKGEKV